MSHTPGPWKVAHSGYANTPFVVYAGSVAPQFNDRSPLMGVNHIAEVSHDEGPAHEEQKHNAALIAAAPEMLEALKRARRFIVNGTQLGYIEMPETKEDPAHETLRLMERAIAKAEVMEKTDANS